MQVSINNITATLAFYTDDKPLDLMVFVNDRSVDGDVDFTKHKGQRIIVRFLRGTLMGTIKSVRKSTGVQVVIVDVDDIDYKLEDRYER